MTKEAEDDKGLRMTKGLRTKGGMDSKTVTFTLLLRQIFGIRLFDVIDV